MKGGLGREAREDRALEGEKKAVVGGLPIMTVDNVYGSDFPGSYMSHSSERCERGTQTSEDSDFPESSEALSLWVLI